MKTFHKTTSSEQKGIGIITSTLNRTPRQFAGNGWRSRIKGPSYSRGRGKDRKGRRLTETKEREGEVQRARESAKEIR